MRWILILVLFVSCKSEKQETAIVEPIEIKKIKILHDYNTEEWMEITTEDSGILLDIRYASDNNFTKQQIYPCGRCFVRPSIGRRLLRIQNDIKERYKLGLKIFDGYRPRPAQQKLWDIVPNATYVTKPSKGSMHNRGMAVDITLVDKDGNELDMGTDYDFFGKEAHHTCTGHKESILKNRRFLKNLMELHGFKSIRTEWWHYSVVTEKAELSDWEWECNPI